MALVVHVKAMVHGMIFQFGHVSGHVYYGHAHQAIGET
jgi:hypothetical protein